MSYMEILSLQKGFLEKNGINLDDYRNTFIRKTYTLLLLEFICIGGISLFSYFIATLEMLWIFWLLIIVCQLCHFYFEFSPAILTDQSTKKTFNYIFSIIYLISLSITFLFFWGIVGSNIGDRIWIIYLQIGSVILLLNFYANMTGTHFQGQECWIIVLVTPIGIEFLLNTVMGIYSPLFQTFLTLIITWYCSFMLQITQEQKFLKEFTFDEIQVLCCKLLGVQYQILVSLIKSILRSNNNQNDLSVASYEVKIKYFKQISITFSSFIMLMQLYQMYGCDTESFCQTSFLLRTKVNDNETIDLSFAPFYWISLSFCLALYPLILIFHRRINYIIKWILVVIQIFCYEFMILGFSNYLALNTKDQEAKQYLLQISFCIFSGLGIGLQSYSTIKKEDIDYKLAFKLSILCPVCILISQIQFAIQHFGSIFIAYQVAILFVFTIYLCIILYELHLQIHQEKIDINAKEYQLGCMLILQPIQTIICRIVTLFI